MVTSPPPPENLPRGPSFRPRQTRPIRFDAPARPAEARTGSRDSSTPPRVLFVNQYYWPDNASTAQHLTDLVESLAAKGFDCTVVCSQGSYKSGQRKRPGHETHNGVKIHRLPATSFGRRSTMHRMVDYLTFYIGALLRSLTLGKFDVAVTLSTPPIIGLIGTVLRFLRGTQHVYWSMDLHPDASIGLGRMNPSHPVVALLARLSDFVYRKADRVVALGPYMADRLARKGVRPARLVEIPVWSRAEEIYPLPRAGHPLRAQLGLQDKFVAMYSGNLGLAHSSEEFLAAARHFRDRDDIVFLFVGGGPRIGEVKQAKEAGGLDNVLLLDYFPREQLYASLSLADVHLVSMRPEMTGIVVPGKLYGVMASARPVVFVGPDHCETADTIREHNCGRTVRRDDSASLIAAIELLSSSPELCSDLGSRGREAFESFYERGICCEMWGDLLSDLAGPPTPAPCEAPRANERSKAVEIGT